MHNLFFVYFVKLYTFRSYQGLSSGGTTICIQQLVLIILFRWLSVVLVELFHSNQDNRQSSKKNNKYQLLYTYGCTYLLMMGLDTSETYRGWRNIIRISCALSWLSFTQLYRDARSTKHKICPTAFARKAFEPNTEHICEFWCLSSRGDWSCGLLGYDTVQSVFRVRNLKMEAISFSAKLLNYQALRRHNSDTLNTCDSNSHPH